jgi:DNA polymerase-3 subunit gamma/tau
MTSEVFYRKWRPQTFTEVAGQEPITRTLTNAVGSGKAAHAYLFTGPRGTGKTTTGRLLAKAVNCTDPHKGEPCNACDSCRLFLEGRALDLIELDAASNRGIDEIRSLRDKVGFAPAAARYKLYLVDEVHMLTEPAFNALLKTLEEPPPHVIFVLATTEPHKVPATIASRCQRFDFRRIPLAAIVEVLGRICREEKVKCPAEGLELIARSATGSLRDALNLLEQLIDYYGRKLTLADVQGGLGLVGDARSGELARLTLQGDLAAGLALIASTRDDGLDMRQFQREVIGHLRDLLLVKAGAEAGLSITHEQTEEMKALAAGVAADRIVRALKTFGQADLRADPQSSLPLELALAECVLGPIETEAPAPGPQAAEAARPPPPRPAPAPARPASLSGRQAGGPGRPTRSRIEAWAATEEETPPAPTRRAAAQATPEHPPEGPVRATAPPVEGPAVAASGSAEGDVEPTPQPEPSPAAVPSGLPAGQAGPLTLEQARERWREIYSLTRQINRKAGALLNSGCEIVEVKDGALVFGFRHEWMVEHMNSGDGGSNLKALQEAVDGVLGQGLSVRCIHAPEADSRPASARRGGHLVEAAREMGARILPEQE